MVSCVLASGHDLVTVPVWLSPQAHQQRQPPSQGSWLRPDRQAGPHCSRLLMKSWALGKDVGRDSPFHVGDSRSTHTSLSLDTKQPINLNMRRPGHVVRQCHSGAWNAACRSSRRAQYHTLHLQFIQYLMSLYEIILFDILLNLVNICKI